jgi:hypothetical protein
MKATLTSDPSSRTEDRPLTPINPDSICPSIPPKQGLDRWIGVNGYSHTAVSEHPESTVAKKNQSSAESTRVIHDM